MGEMLADVPWFIYVFVGGILLVGLIDTLQRPARRRKRLEQIAQLRIEAERRGWRVEYEMRSRGATLKFRGSREGVAWELESTVHSTRGARLESGGSTHSRAVWRTDAGRVAEGQLLVVWPSFGQPDIQQAGTGAAQFFVDLLVTPLINGLGADRVDRQLFTRAQPFQNDALSHAYFLRTTNPELMQAFLDGGAAAALGSAAEWLSSREANHLIVGVVSDAGVTLLIEGWVEELARVAQLADVGVALAEAAQRAAAAAVRI